MDPHMKRICRQLNIALFSVGFFSMSPAFCASSGSQLTSGDARVTAKAPGNSVIPEEQVEVPPNASDQVLLTLHDYSGGAGQSNLKSSSTTGNNGTAVSRSALAGTSAGALISNANASAPTRSSHSGKLLIAGGGNASAGSSGAGRVNSPVLEQVPVEQNAPPVAPPPDVHLRDPKTNEPVTKVDPNHIPASKLPPPPETPFAPEGELRRGLPAPLDPVFPSTEYTGSPMIGAPDSNPVYPLEGAIYKACPMLKKARIQIYGWGDPGGDYNTSSRSAIPLSYAIVPRHVEMEQSVLRIERTLDTVQTEHKDWGFRLSNVYGIDYRYTTAQGWYPASNELLKSNSLYGYDPVECYGQIYLPKIAKGTVVRFGRYISPPDIEAQLAPDNYLWTHSLMFTYDAYTHTGVQTSFKLNDRLMYQVGLHGGSDMAAWAPTAIPTLETFLRYTTKSNKDSFYGGIDGINNGRFRGAREVMATQNIAAAESTILGTTVSPESPSRTTICSNSTLPGDTSSRKIYT